MVSFEYVLDLQLFAEGGDGGQGAGVTAGDAGQQGTTGEDVPLSEIRYGKQESETPRDAGAGPGEVSGDDAEAEFEALIKGRFKQAYDKRVQDTIQKRLKGTKDKVEQFDALQSSILPMLADKYGVDAADIKGLQQAIEDDDSYYEAEAFEKGLTVAQLKEIKSMERENAQLRAMQQEQQQREQIDQDLARWMEEAKQVERVYKGFNFQREINDPQTGPQFLQLLRDNVSMQAAFFALHHDEIIPQAQQFAYRQGQKQAVDTIRSGGLRPAENGTRGNSTAVVKNDVTKLTKADREEIIRRVERGERIVF